MCGILGWVSERSAAISEAQLRNALKLMRHRGPDSEGLYSADLADGYQVGLAHSRLAIIDLSPDSKQPMHVAEGPLVGVFNGEIYNYIELRTELRALGHSFKTDGDTEVLMRSYLQWGEDCVTRFRGMFAFCILDRRDGSLFWARDAFGKKPLYMAEIRGALVFGSEINAIWSLQPEAFGFNAARLGDYLVNRYVPGPETFFKGIRKVPPGSTVRWSRGRIRCHTYFEPPVPVEADQLRERDALEGFKAQLDEAVKIRMRSDAPFGAYLSGGVDSSAIVALMMAHSSRPIRTYSVGFGDGQQSELGAASTVATALGTKHQELVLNASDYFQLWEQATVHRGAPVSEPADLAIAQLSLAAKREVSMVLTGEGADELLAGYPKHRIERVVPLYQRVAPRGARNAVAGAMEFLPLRAHRLRVLTAATEIEDRDARLRFWFGGMTMSECRDLLGGQCELGRPTLIPPEASALRAALFWDQTSWLPDNLLERGDRMLMMGSVEGRMPFMDTELAKFVAKVPDHMLASVFAGGKLLLRRAVRDLLPKGVSGRRKKGFPIPIAHWFRTTQREELQALLLSSDSKVRRLLEDSILSRLVHDHLNGTRDHSRVLWSLASLEQFLRVYKLA